MRAVSINNQTLITIRRVSLINDKLRLVNSKDWIDNLLDEDDNEEGQYMVEYEDQSFGDLDIDYTHSQ